jgi:flagellar hook-length control protein FliK
MAPGALAAADPRAPDRAARQAAAGEITLLPAEAAASSAPARPGTTVGTPTGAPTAGTDPLLARTDRDAGSAASTTAITATPAEAAAAAAAAALAAASISPTNARGVAAPTATPIVSAVAAAGPQQGAAGIGTTATGAEGQRSSDAASMPRSGLAGTAPPASTDAASSHPGAPDGVPHGMASTDAPGRDAMADAARPAIDGAPARSGLKDDAAAAARPPEPSGVLAPAPAGTPSDTQDTSTRADALRVAEAGASNISASAGSPTPMATLAPTGSITAASAPPAAAPVPEARIPLPLDSPAFAPALGAQISLFARDGVQTARLQLNPAEMGPISVQIALDGNAARVDFQADLAGTREVIEASLPALAGALQDAGLTLTGGGVFQQAPDRQGQDHPPAPAPSPRSAGRDRDGSQAGPPLEPLVRARRGLVDLVA